MRNPLAVGIVLAGLVALSPVIADTYHGNNGGGVTGHTTQDGRELARLADQYGADSYGFGKAGTILDDGLFVLFRLPDFDAVIPGDEIAGGIYWAPMGLSIVSDGGCNAYTFDSIVIEFGEATLVKAGGLHVACQSGWYACCYCIGTGDDACPVARCRRNGTPEINPPDGCQGGGQGSTECSISRDQCP